MAIRDTLVFKRFVLPGFLLMLAQGARAERLFVGVLETDGFQSAIYDASAFGRGADLPSVLEMVNTALSKNMALPSFAGVSGQDTLRIVQSVDTALPLNADNPSNVAIIPLIDNGATLLRAFAAAYGKRTPLVAATTLFENPSDTNLLPRVAVAIAGHHALTSTSRDALAWAWNNRTQLIDAPPQRIPGTLRVLANPQRLADLLGTRSAKVAPLLNVDRLLRDFETISFAVAMDGQAIALTVRGKPKAQTALSALVTAQRLPQERFWLALPDNAFFASLSACDAPKLWDDYLGNMRFRLLRPVTGLAPQESFGGERLVYLAPTPSKQGLCFVQIEPVTNAAAVREAIQKLQTADAKDGVTLKREAPRRAGSTLIETYGIRLQPPADAPGSTAKPSETSTLFTLMSLFLKQAVLETAVADGHLITVIGPAYSLEHQLSQLTFAEKLLTLNRKISGQDTALDGRLTVGSSLQLAALLRYIVSIVPGVKPEHLRVLPVGGDGATFGICQSEDRTLTASLRFQANEISALQRINRDGREVLQELFFQMFTSQMMNIQVAPQREGDKPTP
jgi:hypothetical protein